MRYKLGDGIVHVKLMLLAGQNKVVFTGSNFGDGDVAPYVPYENYVDGAWYFAADAVVVNSFKTRYDDLWTNTTLYGNYGNIAGPLTRKYSTFAIDPGVNFLPNQNLAEDYGVRTIAEIDRETQKIDLTMYRVTDAGICDALLRALKRGVPVRLLTEPHEYRFANRSGAESYRPVQHRPAVRGRSADPDAQASGLITRRRCRFMARVDDLRLVELELAIFQFSGRT